jgi:radical SAM enzyme (TIGR01210 family)
MMYGTTAAERSQFVLAARGAKNSLDPRRAYGAFVEQEPDPPVPRSWVPGAAPASNERGTVGPEAVVPVVPVATVLLTNRECPWKCVFCDLWKNTLDETVPRGAIVEQIRAALADLPPARWIKLYNAGSFFDPRAVPSEDLDAIADLVAPFERVIVESHPSLVARKPGSALLRLRDRLAAASGGRSGRLEVAMGLETVHPQALERLNKGMTVEDFARAADVLRGEGIALRTFVLLQPPFVSPAESVGWALRSLDVAWDLGSRVVALIPTRAGNGAMEALAAEGEFVPPTLARLERAFDEAFARRRSVLLADLWDLERFSACPACFPARRDRLARMNLAQRGEPAVACAACG